MPHPDGVQLRFSREVETAIYRSLPHHLGELVQPPFPVPIGFVGGTDSVELRQAGLDATRRLVGSHFKQIEGGHLFPMESPELAAQLTREMIAELLAEALKLKPRGRFRVKSGASGAPRARPASLDFTIEKPQR